MAVGAVCSALAAPLAPVPAYAAPPSSGLSPSPLSLTWALPQSAAGRQLGWFVGAAGRLPVPRATIQSHFDKAFLAQVPPSELNSVLKGLKAAKPWRLVTLDAASARELVADVRSGATSVGVELSVDSRGLISGLFLQPSPALPKAPTTWAALDRQVRSLAPRVGFEAAELTADGRCRALSSVAPTTARPLASMFKLYVLATVARQVAAGRLSWARRVALASQLRSLPSGLLQVEPPAPGSPSAS